MLEKFPKLSRLVSVIDDDLSRRHPQFFGRDAVRPFSPLKPYKVIHDPLWGTNSFTWRELILIDSPILQRLRSIHQTGLACYVYPSATHTRFEHSLGVLTIASKIFDALSERQSRTLVTIVNEIYGKDRANIDAINQLRQELRLAALLHDVGHSLFSHASEKVYSQIGLLAEAADELSDLVGKEKGAGEVLSFCIANTSAVTGLLERAKNKLDQGYDFDDLEWKIDLFDV